MEPLSIDFAPLEEILCKALDRTMRRRIRDACRCFLEAKKPVRKVARLAQLAEMQKRSGPSRMPGDLRRFFGELRSASDYSAEERMLYSILGYLGAKHSDKRRTTGFLESVGLQVERIILSVFPFRRGRPMAKPWRRLVSELRGVWTSCRNRGPGVWHDPAGDSNQDDFDKPRPRWRGEFLDLVCEVVRQLKPKVGPETTPFPKGIISGIDRLTEAERTRELNCIGDSLVSILKQTRD